MYKQIFITIFFSIIGVRTFATPQVVEDQYVVINNLKGDLLVYDGDYESFVPYVLGTSFSSNAVTSILNLDRYQGYQLLVKHDPNMTLLINRKLVEYYKETGRHLYSIDSLRSVYGDQCILSIYKPGLVLSSFELAVVNLQQAPIAKGETEAELMAIAREPQNFENFFITALVLLLIGYAVVRNVFPKVFSSYYDLSRAFSFRFRDEPNFAMKIGGRGHIGFIILYSFIFGFLLLVLLHEVESMSSVLGVLKLRTFTSYMYSWLVLSVGVLFLQLVKYFLLLAVARIFNLGEFAYIHFFDFLRISFFFYTIIFAVVIILILGGRAFSSQGALILLQIGLVFAVFRVLIIYFKLLRFSSFRNTYLFSYLCTTEILPFLIGLKILFN